jgi:predicted acetyltransferase
MSDKSFLARPSAAFRASYLDALREGFAMDGDPGLEPEAIDAIDVDFATHLASLDKDGQTPFTHEGRLLQSVPSNTFWLIEGDTFIGAVSIRARADTHILAHFGGHVGFRIRPSMRRRGHGTRQLALALAICRGIGISLVRLSCDEDNVGSRRIIETNGGLLLRRCPPAWYADHPYLLYEIPLV